MGISKQIEDTMITAGKNEDFNVEGKISKVAYEMPQNIDQRILLL